MLNNIDVTNRLIEIPDKKQAKKWGEDVFLPEYEFKFYNGDQWLSKSQIRSMVANSYTDDFLIEFSKNADVLISGNNLDIIEEDRTATMVIGTLNDKFNEAVKLSFVKENPAYILKKIVESYGISVNPVHYRKAYGKLKADKIRLTVIPAEDTKLHDIISNIAEKAGLDVFLANDELIIDYFTGKDDTAFTLYDSQIYSAKLKTNKNEDNLFTNFSFVSTVSEAKYTDEKTGDYFKAERKEFGDKPYSEKAGGTGETVQYPDVQSGIQALRNFLTQYSQELKVCELTLPIDIFCGLRLDTVFSWYSDYFRFSKRFSVRDISYQYQKGTITATLEEVAEIQALDGNTGFGVSFGESFGDL